MSTQPPSMKGPIRNILLAIPIMALILVIVIGILNLSLAAVSKGATASPTSTPDPVAVPSVSSSPIQAEDASQAVPQSEAKAPSRELILQFEQAYNTPDFKSRLTLLGGIATSQYLESIRTENRYGPNPTGLRNDVDVKASVVESSCDASGLSCYVLTHVYITSRRNGRVVNNFQAPLHATDWINTAHGWLVANEATVR